MQSKTKFLKQKGQSLVLSLILMSFAAMTVLYSYNTAQLNIKSTKLQHTADNTAYSIATIAVRDFNFKAYTNRASVANQVAVAQMVGLSSWFNMTDRFTQNACSALCWVPYLGQVINAIRSGVGYANQVVQPFTEIMITAENSILGILRVSQSAIHYASAVSSFTTAQQIVKANDNKAELSLVQNAQLINDIRNVWFTFQKQHNRNLQNRYNTQFTDFKAVIMDSRDPFSEQRSYKLSSIWSKTLWPLRWKTLKAGGSELVSNRNDAESWTSMDTIGFHLSKYRCSWSGCRWRGYKETPIGWGATRSDDRANINRLRSSSLWGRSRGINKKSSRLAAYNQEESGNYSGVQSFYGLSNSASKKNHTDNIVVVVSKEQKDVRTTSSVDLAENTIDPATTEKLLGDRLSNISASQAYYSRPSDLWARSDSKYEYGNLYNRDCN
ncbi:hypothetical protein GCM10009347_42650 [Shewanella algicola]|uniref:Uncharacterized protein n=1 Tax=Shewanella algicola TaxID=640633 RepID=A0A9X1ZAA8_9GAMM|nr:hypothetical protein [Shewanella algicola]MCL1107842.1 hypothetical protein [Shewanella algicola]GGP73915.1 hypothetical protein GCM10009347_42650 [Shewanella algicola]